MHRPRHALVRTWPALAVLAIAVALIAVGWKSLPAQPEHAEAAASAQSAPREPSALRIGMNLNGVTDYSREWAFVDVFKHARPWISQSLGGGPWDNGQPIDTTPEGWPLPREGQAAVTLMCRELEGHYPGGRYICTYTGKGKIKFGFDATIVTSEPGRIELDVTPSHAGIVMRIEASDPNDPIRDARVWMPGFAPAPVPGSESGAQTATFHPLFLERLKPFKVIRFMDWGATNDSKQVRWSDRATPASLTQAGPSGVAVEHMIELCNALGASPWFCMPHLADDEYVRAYATLVKQTLRPDVKVYVEWSNEVWNTIFEQGKWCYAQAGERGIMAPEVAADEAKRDWAIWHEVFGDQKDRIVRVAAGQSANPWILETLTERLDGAFDAVSCAAYFHPLAEDWRNFTAETTLEEIFLSTERQIDELCLPEIARHKELADRWSRKLSRPIPLVIYEGGPAFAVGNSEPAYLERFFEAQNAPAMYGTYGHLLRGLREIGVSDYHAFVFAAAKSKHGSWGHLQYQDEHIVSAPKYRVLLDAAQDRLK